MDKNIYKNVLNQGITPASHGKDFGGILRVSLMESNLSQNGVQINWHFHKNSGLKNTSSSPQPGRTARWYLMRCWAAGIQTNRPGRAPKSLTSLKKTRAKAHPVHYRCNSRVGSISWTTGQECGCWRILAGIWSIRLEIWKSVLDLVGGTPNLL